MNEKYDSRGNEVYYENSDGNWYKTKYDQNNNTIYQEYSDGYWYKYKYDKLNSVIYYENSDGQIDYSRGKEYYLKHRKKSLNIQKLIKKYTNKI